MSRHKLDNQTKQFLRAEVENTFKKFKEEYPGIIEVPMRDSIAKIESLGIFVLIAAAPDKVSGFCMTIGEDTFIFVNKNHVVGRQNFSLWHEVYHWYTNSTGSVSLKGDEKNDAEEFSADYFASLVLIDKQHLHHKITQFRISEINYISNDQIIKLQHYFGVSYSAMVSKIIEAYPNAKLGNRYSLGLPQRRKELVGKTKKLGLDVGLISPSNNIYVSSEFFTLLQKLLNENKITIDKVNSLINILEEELD